MFLIRKILSNLQLIYFGLNILHKTLFFYSVNLTICFFTLRNKVSFIQLPNNFFLAYCFEASAFLVQNGRPSRLAYEAVRKTLKLYALQSVVTFTECDTLNECKLCDRMLFPCLLWSQFLSEQYFIYFLVHK